MTISITLLSECSDAFGDLTVGSVLPPSRTESLRYAQSPRSREPRVGPRFAPLERRTACSLQS